jgi:DNA polymerase III subunit delta'
MTEIVGHEATINSFLAAMRGERPHHGWLFAGSEGLGKASLAIAAARRLLAEAADPGLPSEGIALRPDHPTAQLIEAWSHPDFILVDRLPKDAKLVEKPRIEWPEDVERRRSIRLEQIRDLGRRFSTHATYSKRRIVIIDGAEDCEVGASNALLKMLEEPPAGTIFILVSHATGRLLPTIRSRCRLLRFSGLDDAVMTAVLLDALPKASAEEIGALVQLAEGAPGRAIRLAGLDVGGMTNALERIARSGDPDNIDRAALSQSMTAKAAQARFEAFLGLVPGFMAAQAKTRRGAALGEAISHWEKARGLAQHAVAGSLDPQAVAFALASHVAALAPTGGAVKA